MSHCYVVILPIFYLEQILSVASVLEKSDVPPFIYHLGVFTATKCSLVVKHDCYSFSELSDNRVTGKVPLFLWR